MKKAEEFPDVKIKEFQDLAVEEFPDVNVKEFPDVNIKEFPDMNIKKFPDMNIKEFRDVSLEDLKEDKKTTWKRLEPVFIPCGPGIPSDDESDEEKIFSQIPNNTKSISFVRQYESNSRRKIEESSLINLDGALNGNHKSLYSNNASFNNINNNEEHNETRAENSNFRSSVINFDGKEIKKLPVLDIKKENDFRTFDYFNHLLLKQNYLKDKRYKMEEEISRKTNGIHTLVDTMSMMKNQEVADSSRLPNISAPVSIKVKPRTIVESKDPHMVNYYPCMKSQTASTNTPNKAADKRKLLKVELESNNCKNKYSRTSERSTSGLKIYSKSLVTPKKKRIR